MTKLISDYLPQMTLEAFPSESNYRNLGDVFTRPTIEQLIDGKGTEGVKDPEKGDEEKERPLTISFKSSIYVDQCRNILWV